MRGAKRKSGAVVHRTEAALKKVGKRLAKRRKEMGFTNSDVFAYDTEINRSQYGKYEAGHDMNLSTLIRIVHSMGLTLEEFFGEKI